MEYIDVSTPEGGLRKALAGGLNPIAKSVKSFIDNGYEFQTIQRERYQKAQNYGVMVEVDGQAYYGRLTDIYELDYYEPYKVVALRCDWVDINRGLKTFRNCHACVNFSKFIHTGQYLHNHPLVFSSQAKQRNKKDGYMLIKPSLETFLI